MKTHFSRKNYIALGITYFYLLAVLFSAICLDASGTFVKVKNLLALMNKAMGLPSVNPGFAGWALLICVVIYFLLFSVSFIYEMRLAKYYDNVVFSKKWSLIYVGTFFVSFGLCFGIGMVAQYPYEPAFMIASLQFLGESLLMGLIIYILALSFIAAICMIWINMKHIDEPFRFFGAKTQAQDEADKKAEEDEEKALEEQGNLAASFGEADASGSAVAGVGAGGSRNGTGNGDGTQVDSPLKDKERVFPGLCNIDLISESYKEEEFDDNINLKDLVSNFRKYLAKKEKLYFDEATIRAFISGLAASRLIILEGLSGTGKSSLARYFSEYISEESFFEPVQATWRDRTSILGFYNDFSRTYNETEFLKRLYDATYKPHDINIMVLDEVNISRVEYYFADFLSIMEYPVDKWKLKIMQLPYDFDAPNHLEDGILKIEKNTWFIGTANKDDSTYTITDKVYDRAIAISFDDRNDPFEVNEDVDKIKLSYDKLMSLFAEAIDNKENSLTSDDLAKFKILTDYTFDSFDLTFGNRIMHQIEQLVPVYYVSGGTKEDALDFMFARKVVAKLEGRFEDYVKDGLTGLKRLILKTYGPDSFKLTNETIDKLLRKL